MFDLWTWCIYYYIVWRLIIVDKWRKWQLTSNTAQVTQTVHQKHSSAILTSMGQTFTSLSGADAAVLIRPLTHPPLDINTRSPLMNLPSEIWGVITSFFGNDGRALRALMSSSRSSYELLHMPSAVTRLHINLSWKGGKRITEWPTAWFSKFPGLVSIGLHLNPVSKVAFSIEIISNLPRNLRHLHLAFPDSISDEMLPYLPPFLQTLNLEHNYRITDDGFKLLPESLESLHLPENTNQTARCITNLPATIRSLTIHTADEITEAFMRRLPPLTSLRLCGKNRVPGPSMAALPPTLKLLTWSLKDGLEYLDMPLLPEGLMELTCFILHDADEALAALPKRLLRLTITHSSDITTKGIELLPRGLTSLELTSNTNLSEKAIRHLPPNLQTLCLPKNRMWTPQQLMELPQSIHTLKMTMNSQFTNASFGVLPHNLFYLSILWNEDITEECVRFLPPSLQRLEIRAKFEDCPGSSIQPIDECFPTAITIPRYQRERTSSGYLINMRPWDLYLFQVDIQNASLFHLSMSPNNVPNLWGPSVIKPAS
jgi:hypothetical protein